MIPGSANPLLLATAAPTGYNIERSLRFNSSDSAYLSRTPSSSGNRRTWTWAGWVKRSALTAARQTIFRVNTPVETHLSFSESAQGNPESLMLYSGGSLYLLTTPVFRDVSAWYHIVVTVDTTNGTSSNRAKLYVNGTQVTTFNTATYPAQNFDTGVNTTNIHYLAASGNANEYFSGYLADIHFIDGQALTPTSFGEFDVNNVWQPKAYTGSYGTNGFQLKFADNSAATAAALGKDTSGNGHNWTPTNLSVTAGAGNDSLVDVPTNGTEVDTGAGGQVRGNYCTWNPLSNSTTLSNGNLQSNQPASQTGASGTICYPLSGKWIFETQFINTSYQSGSGEHIGIINASPTLAQLSTVANSDCILYRADGKIYRNTGGGLALVQTVAAATPSDVIGVAVNIDSGTLQFYKNGSTLGTSITLTASVVYCPWVLHGGGAGGSHTNFGQRPFAYTAPSGFKALCTANLPTPTIANGATAMDVLTWTGTDSGTTRSFTGLNFSPDLIWTKNRSKAYEHLLYDSVRGTGTASLATNTTAAEGGGLPGSYGYLSAFGSQGFTFTRGSFGSGADPDGYAYYDELNAAYVAWTWDAGSSTVTNTSGSISSQVRASTTNGCSVVTYTGTGANATVGHGLGVAPSLVITKRRDSTSNWLVQHRAAGAGYLILNSTAAYRGDDPSAFNGTFPTSTVFSVGSGVLGNQVAYCFAPVAGFSAFGSYTGNGSTDGPFVFCDFRPRWIMFKRTDAWHWFIFDSSRLGYNAQNPFLAANLTVSEDSNDTYVDLLSNGFKLRSINQAVNNNGSTFIYAAFAEHPFSASRAR